MTPSFRLSTLACASLIALSAGGASLAQDKSMAKSDAAMAKPAMAADSVIAAWPATPKEVAMKTIAKYGQPNEATPTMLVWHDNGPWKKTVVFREEFKHDFPVPHTDLMQQWIAYKVPLDKYDDMAKYDGSVVIERTTGMISARCDKEEANFLAINLAHDVATGKRSATEARAFYAETVSKLMKGEKPPYTQSLQFRAPAGTADPDMPAKRPNS